MGAHPFGQRSPDCRCVLPKLLALGASFQRGQDEEGGSVLQVEIDDFGLGVDPASKMNQFVAVGMMGGLDRQVERSGVRAYFQPNRLIIHHLNENLLRVVFKCEGSFRSVQVGVLLLPSASRIDDSSCLVAATTVMSALLGLQPFCACSFFSSRSVIEKPCHMQAKLHVRQSQAIAHYAMRDAQFKFLPGNPSGLSMFAEVLLGSAFARLFATVLVSPK